MMCGVNWLPPWSFAERQRWAEANPGLAGFYFGLALAIYFGVWATVFTRVGVGIMVGFAVWLVFWPLFAIAVKRRWFQGLVPRTSISPRPFADHGGGHPIAY